MASNRKPSRIPSSLRDPITGEALQRSTLKMRDVQRTAPHKIDPPIRLHVRAEEYAYRDDGDDGPRGNLRERMGSNAYAPVFLKFLEESLRIERRSERQWWNMSYIFDRCVAHTQSIDKTFSLDELNIAIACYRGYDIVDAGRTHFWIKRACQRVARYVRKTFYPAEAEMAA